ncbi:hypothetical protein ACP275_14G059400 [Erythranthe tilingii]
MSGFTKMKRVTDPLDAEARARIVGRGSDYFSGGGNCSPQSDDDDTFSSLSELFLGFNADDDSGGDSCPDDCERGDSTSSVREFGGGGACGAAECLIKSVVLDLRDAYKKVLMAHVWKAVQVFSCARSSREIVRRNVMAYLRNCGYNAAICRTKWEGSGGLSAGNYEFIDVLRAENNSARYYIDLDFAAEFEIARPTESYDRLMQHMPRVFVGTGEDLKRISKAVSDAAKRSLKSRGLHLPPWRKNRFMQNKWLGPFRRTTTVFPATFASAQPVNRSYGVKCRAVGFDAAVNGGHLLLLSTTRTRLLG